MIPITLTSVSSVENLGVQVWLLGEARAIPRNYYHVVLDEMPIWLNANYNLQLIDAVHEAPGKHGFITEYAGQSSVVAGVLDYTGRFGNLDVLRQKSTPSEYLAFLRNNGYSFDGTLLSILARAIPEPPSLVAQRVGLADFYQRYDYWIAQVASGDVDGGVGTSELDPAALTDEIAQRVVQPARDANALILRHPYLTRMYTALSPVDMTIDPVFSFNPDLPPVSNQLAATRFNPCRGAPWLATDSGFEVQLLSGLPPSLNLPAALRVELLRESGPPAIVQDNHDAIVKALGKVEHNSLTSTTADDRGCGCAIGKTASARGNAALLLVLAGVALGVRRLRRRRA
jgi:MYXO-CTERM domain-containing protein